MHTAVSSLSSWLYHLISRADRLLGQPANTDYMQTEQLANYANILLM